MHPAGLQNRYPKIDHCTVEPVRACRLNRKGLSRSPQFFEILIVNVGKPRHPFKVQEIYEIAQLNSHSMTTASGPMFERAQSAALSGASCQK
jgi:hypothetical protein